ncbi:MAG: tryptophan synthase subunit alpha [candidate division NC10 bacterium]|jgi:tryptophan synthase alpha chain|nr:tryptophan synthase subunit alpha [candidate division NC10 bacterium]
MNRIDRCFEGLRATGGKALIPFITAGDPDFATTRELAWAFEGAGADLLELGVPFSDPLADGTTIQRASQRALENGATLKGVIGVVEQIRARSQIPVALMSYINPILRMGPREFAMRASDAGVDGIIIPDLPPEEAHEVQSCCAASAIYTIFLAAPTSTEARLRRIVESSRGYIYYVSVKGVTGARDALQTDLELSLSRVRRLTDKPIAVGFGISTPAQVSQVAGFVDGVIVGSAIVERIERGMGKPGMVGEVAGFISTLKQAIQ